MKSNLFQLILAKLFHARRKTRGDRPTPDTSSSATHNPEMQAIVDEAIVPYFGGRVQYHNSWWPALCEQNITLHPGEIVYVVGRHNITLLVEPASSPHRVVKS